MAGNGTPGVSSSRVFEGARRHCQSSDERKVQNKVEDALLSCQVMASLGFAFTFLTSSGHLN